MGYKVFYDICEMWSSKINRGRKDIECHEVSGATGHIRSLYIGHRKYHHMNEEFCYLVDIIQRSSEER